MYIPIFFFYRYLLCRIDEKKKKKKKLFIVGDKKKKKSIKTRSKRNTVMCRLILGQRLFGKCCNRRKLDKDEGLFLVLSNENCL